MSRALSFHRSRAAAGAAAVLAVALTAPAGAQDNTLRVDPALPVAGQPVRLLSTLGRICDWYIQGDGYEILPGEIRLRVEFVSTIITTPPPCGPPSNPETFVWELPAGSLAPGFWRVFAGSPGGLFPPFYVFDSFGFTVLPASPQLELHGGEFVAVLTFTDPRTGTEHQATAVPLSSESGLFWFFSGDNVEVTVKLLDGRPVNGHWWFFIASQTTLPFALRVEHRTRSCTEGGNPFPCPAKTYTFAGGESTSRQDTSAFPDEP